MEPSLQLFLILRFGAAVAAWVIWRRRRGRTRMALSLSLSGWCFLSTLVVLAGGSWLWLAALDTASGFWLVLAMVPRRLETSALSASEAKFAAAFRHSLDSVMLTAIPSGEILEVNRGFTLITGIDRADAIGKTTLELDIWVNLEDRSRMMQALRRDGRIERQAADFVQRPYGNSRHGLLWGEPVDIQGRPCLLTVVRDITDARRQDEERARLIDELEAKNRELERFAYTVAHDLRNPLQSIRGFVDLARHDLERGDLGDIPDHLMRISGGSEHLQDLLASLLELSKAGKIIKSKQPVELHSLIDEALELLTASVQSAKAEIVIAPALPKVHGDRTRLLQVMQNLLANALGCLGDQPTPRIEIGHRPADPPVFFVRDNGLGIARDQIESIFGLFERGTNPGEGTGIGLALVRRIIESHGGSVWAESEGSGRGATFCFTLPG